MKKIIYSILFVFILTLNLNAQNEENEKEPVFWIGPFAGLNYNYHFLNFGSLPPFPNCCPEFNSAKGWGFTLGALFDIKLSKAVFLNMRVGISDIGAKMTTEEYIGGTFIKTGTNPPQLVDTSAVTDYNIDTKLMHANFEPTLSLKFFDKIGLDVGVKFAYLFISRFSQEEVLKSPDNVTFLDGSRTRNDYSNELIPEANSFQMFGIMGVSYSLMLARDLYLVPEVRYNVPFIDVSNAPTQATDYWKASTFQFGASLKVPIYPPPPPPKVDTVYHDFYKRDTTVIVERNVIDTVVFDRSESHIEKTYDDDVHIYSINDYITDYYIHYIPEIIGLEATVETYGIDKNGRINKDVATITIEELEVEEGFPLLTHVFFKQGSADLYSSGLKLLKPSQTAGFDENNLDKNTMSIYSNLLNIIASRMKKYPDADIVITGCNNNVTEDEKGNLKLSISRANVVRDYLISVWGIEPPRIKIRRRNLPQSPGNSTVEDGIAENQRAEISSSNHNITNPVFLHSITKTATPPLIVIKPRVESEAGLNKYEVTVNQAGNQLRRFTGGGDVPDSLIWEVKPEPMPTTEDDVSIQLVAIDNEGQKVVAEDLFGINQKTIRKKRVELKNDTIIQRYSLILFDYDKADLTKNQIRVLNDIKKEIKPNSKVYISAYTDRTGEKEYNKELAKRRGEETRKRLFVQGAKYYINPIGSDVLIYDNNTPWGRSYCRTVKIEILTPVTK
jgi:outer membrane protein OmpA-like peptidoglycan-associated protein